MKENVSALMDGMLEGQAESMTLDALKRNTELRRTWDAYHLVGDTLRREASFSPGFCDEVMSRLGDEPTVLAPVAGAPRRPAMRWALPLAASVMGVGAVAWVSQMVSQPAALEAPAQVVQAPAPAAQPVKAEAPPVAAAPGTAVATKAAENSAIRAQPAPEYIVAHQAYSSSAGMGGVAQYVRTVSELRSGDSK